MFENNQELIQLFDNQKENQISQQKGNTSIDMPQKEINYIEAREATYIKNESEDKFYKLFSKDDQEKLIKQQQSRNTNRREQRQKQEQEIFDYLCGKAPDDIKKQQLQQITDKQFTSEMDCRYGDMVLVFPNPDYSLKKQQSKFAKLGTDLLETIHKGFIFNNQQDGKLHKKIFVRALGRAFDQIREYQQSEEEKEQENQKQNKKQSPLKENQKNQKKLYYGADQIYYFFHKILSTKEIFEQKKLQQEISQEKAKQVNRFVSSLQQQQNNKKLQELKERYKQYDITNKLIVKNIGQKKIVDKGGFLALVNAKCPLCNNDLTKPCPSCYSKIQIQKECQTTVRNCGHQFHLHCIDNELFNCPLDNLDINSQKIEQQWVRCFQNEKKQCQLDFKTIIRNSILYKLSNDLGIRTRSFLSNNGKYIYTVLFGNKSNLKFTAEEKQIDMQIYFPFADLMSLEPVDKNLRPLRLSQQLKHIQLKDKQYYKEILINANQNCYIDKLQKQKLKIIHIYEQIKSDIRQSILDQNISAIQLIKYQIVILLKLINYKKITKSLNSHFPSSIHIIFLLNSTKDLEEDHIQQNQYGDQKHHNWNQHQQNKWEIYLEYLYLTYCMIIKQKYEENQQLKVYLFILFIISINRKIIKFIK